MTERKQGGSEEKDQRHTRSPHIPHTQPERPRGPGDEQSPGGRKTETYFTKKEVQECKHTPGKDNGCNLARNSQTIKRFAKEKDKGLQDQVKTIVVAHKAVTEQRPMQPGKRCRKPHVRQHGGHAEVIVGIHAGRVNRSPLQERHDRRSDHGHAGDHTNRSVL